MPPPTNSDQEKQRNST